MLLKHIHELTDVQLCEAVCERVTIQPAVLDYAGNVRLAWELAEHLRKQGWMVVVKAIPDGHPFRLDNDDPRALLLTTYACSLSWMRTDTPEGVRRRIHWHPWAFGDTLGQAICRAALTADEAMRR